MGHSTRILLMILLPFYGQFFHFNLLVILPGDSTPFNRLYTYSNRPASPYITVVREGSVQLNLPELTPNCPSDQLPPSSQWFEEIRCGRTTPNSLETALWACFPIRHSGSRRFGEVELPPSHSNLPCRPASPFVTVVRGGSVWSNHPKLT